MFAFSLVVFRVFEHKPIHDQLRSPALYRRSYSTTRYSVIRSIRRPLLGSWHAPRCTRQLPALSRPLHHAAVSTTEAAPPAADEAPGAVSSLIVQPPQDDATIRAPGFLRHAIAYRRHAIAFSLCRKDTFPKVKTYFSKMLHQHKPPNQAQILDRQDKTENL